MATTSLAPRTTSNESIATHCASTMPPHLTHSSLLPLCPPPPSNHWLCTTCAEVEHLSTTGITQGNLEFITFPHSLDNTRNTRMLYCLRATSTLLWGKPRTKLYLCSQPWGNNVLSSDNSIAPQNKIKDYASYWFKLDWFNLIEHKLHQKGLHTSLPVRIEL